MIAWLKQNRTQDMVNKRAEELLYSLNNVPNMSYFPNTSIHLNLDITKNTDYSKYKDRLRKAVLVKGQIYDWILISKINNNAEQPTHRNQAVESYIITKKVESEGNELFNFPHEETTISMKGRSICIDNVQNNSSIGDQLSTRAYIAMNDNTVSNAGMIHTIPRPTSETTNLRLSNSEFDSLKKSLKKFSSGWLV